ncbi:MAG: UDP-N-acetylglucosamine-peptide N-acetylglucosaminyltransferase, partial [Selenomonadaceae bacterium]|nr:UDP-N-acetylglucosamine-peptide N-acetylglucosaminyltransferase [Selenomonadaceae bacterium]
PVISLYGERHGSRFGYSILNNVGIGELAVKNREDYINLAAALANDFETLSILHKNLRGMMTNSPLMNAKNYVRDFYSLLPTPYSLK